MSDTREVTESMAPNEVVAFLNDGTQSGSIPTTLDDILDDIRDRQLPLHGFDEDNTRVVNAVNDWFDDDKIACLVCETKNEQVVYTLSKVQGISGESLVWWWKKYDDSAYTELMGAIEQGRKFQFLLHEAQGNRFFINDVIQEVWKVARDIPREHSLKFFKRAVKEKTYFSGSWETVDDYHSRHWRQWLSRGGFVRFKPKGIDMFVCVSDNRNKGALLSGRNSSKMGTRWECSGMWTRVGLCPPPASSHTVTCAARLKGTVKTYRTSKLPEMTPTFLITDE